MYFYFALSTYMVIRKHGLVKNQLKLSSPTLFRYFQGEFRPTIDGRLLFPTKNQTQKRQILCQNVHTIVMNKSVRRLKSNWFLSTYSGQSRQDTELAQVKRLISSSTGFSGSRLYHVSTAFHAEKKKCGKNTATTLVGLNTRQSMPLSL